MGTRGRCIRTRRTRIWGWAAVIVAAALFGAGCAHSPLLVPQGPDYTFDGAMTEQVLSSYLSRAVSHQVLYTDGDDALLADDIRMFVHIGAKFIGRASIIWETPADLDAHFATASWLAERVHAADEEIILQAGLFEIVDTAVEAVAIPAWVFEAFGLPPQARTYDYDAMLYGDGSLVDYFGAGSSIPDMSQPETRMWFYHRARLYLDAGFEAIHFGVVDAMAVNDPTHEHYADLLGRVRAYAQSNARRHWVLCDTHHKTGWVYEGHTLFDFLSYPLRVQEGESGALSGVLQAGAEDTIYGQTLGGITPAGWEAPRLPYIVEFDNWGSSGQGGQDIGGIWVWGYDEIDWFARLDAPSRDAWLSYAHSWVRATDPYGHLQFPTRRILADPIDERYYWYSANRPSGACENGFDQENAMRAIWLTQ